MPFFIFNERVFYIQIMLYFDMSYTEYIKSARFKNRLLISFLKYFFLIMRRQDISVVIMTHLISTVTLKVVALHYIFTLHSENFIESYFHITSSAEIRQIRLRCTFRQSWRLSKDTVRRLSLFITNLIMLFKAFVFLEKIFLWCVSFLVVVKITKTILI